MKELVSYDNEKDLMALVDDSIEFIMSETKRLVDRYYDKQDDNAYILVSQNITLSFVLNVMNQMRIRQEAFMRSLTHPSEGDSNHLPVNGPDFFKGAEP